MKAFAALADPTRERIVEELAGHDLTVNEIVGRFRLSQPAISRHLRVLRQSGLVSVRPQGTARIYHLEPRRLREIDRWLDRYRRFWAGKLDRLEAFMDETEDKP